MVPPASHAQIYMSDYTLQNGVILHMQKCPVLYYWQIRRVALLSDKSILLSFFPVVTICYLKLSQSTALEQKRFELRLLSPAFHNLWLLLVYFTCSWVRFAKASSTIRNRVNGPAPARAWWTNEPVSKSMAVFSCPLSPFGPWRFSSFTLCNNITSYWTQRVHDNPYRPG